MTYTTSVLIHANALLHNLAEIRKLAPGSKVLAMVKANAYGHDLLKIASILANEVDALGVARIGEALQLRSAGITTPIVLMEGIFEADELPLIVEHNLEVTIHHLPQISMLEQAHLKQPINIWLKLDTGMHRLGLSPPEFIEAYHRLIRHRFINPNFKLMTHFACADVNEDTSTLQQLALFNEITQGWDHPKSLANSAAILRYPNTHADWVRPGLMLYGISPFADKISTEFNLQPVMTLTSRLLSIQQRKKGDTIGYGLTYTCPEDMPIGIISTGYGDGYPRYIPPYGMPILINQQQTQIIGRVSMDMIHVDLRPIKSYQLGDTAILWGEGLPIEFIAQIAHTSPYELICGLTKRVEFKII